MNKVSRKMILGLSMRYMGYHNKAWRHPDVPAGGSTSFSYHLETAQRAEAAKFHMIFYADGLALRASDIPPGFLVRDAKNVDLDPLTLLPAIAARTERIGLVSTASTTYNEPYHVARRLGSLDHISNGRAGWNVVTSWSQQEAWNFGRDEHLGYDERYERAEEFVEVVVGLWNSWERDAFLHDKENGIFYDASKLHVLNHKGKHLKVRGPLTCARTPQGRPIIVQAGASKQGVTIAAKYADVVYASHLRMEDSVRAYDALKSEVANYGRDPNHVKILPGISVFTGATRQEAQDKFDFLQELVDDISGLGLISTYAGDLTGYDLDAPIPDNLQLIMKSLAGRHIARAKRENMTLRELGKAVAAADGGRVLVGTPDDVVDDMQAWFEGGAADGFNVCPPTKPGGVDDFADFIIPELRRRGLFRNEYEGKTLREDLGLPALD